MCDLPTKPSASARRASNDSYLNIPAVISAAEIANVDAIHPGYGLLSENANFAEVVPGVRNQVHRAAARGHPPDGRKGKGTRHHEKTGRADSAGLGRNHRLCRRGTGVGAHASDFRSIVKASAGGGGRGMRIIRSEEELPNQFNAAQSEAAAAFGNGDLYMERFIERPRHIEFQVLADEHGNVMSLGERECSIQRRHQKLVEEAPSVKVTPELRERIGGILVKTLSNIGYMNAGTIEFLMDEDGSLSFIEMNTRIQVEHPVTEMTTDVDLVKAQILIAAGEKLSTVINYPVVFRGHAIECRINAEHPERFTPSAGKITAFNIPGGTGVRVDTAAYAEGVIPPYYDSLIAKLVVRGRDRAEAISRMSRALEMFVVEGIYTSIPLHRRIMADPDFRAGNFDTSFMERFLSQSKEGSK